MGAAVGFHRGAGHVPSYHRMGIHQAAGSWSVQTHLGSQTRFSFASHHTLLFLISVIWARVPGMSHNGAIPMAVGTESCLHWP